MLPFYPSGFDEMWICRWCAQCAAYASVHVGCQFTHILLFDINAFHYNLCRYNFSLCRMLMLALLLNYELTKRCNAFYTNRERERHHTYTYKHSKSIFLVLQGMTSFKLLRIRHLCIYLNEIFSGNLRHKKSLASNWIRETTTLHAIKWWKL